MSASGGFCRIGTAASAAAPTDGVTDPHYTLSNRTPWGSFTNGFLWAVHLPTAPAGTAAVPNGSLSIVIWVRNPVTRRWMNYTVLTGIDAREANVTYDTGPTELYFQVVASTITTDGTLDIEVLEQ
jgi:hypothetical protein